MAALNQLMSTGPSPHSGHALDAANKCPTLWQLKYGINVIPRENVDRKGDLNARGKGTLGHLGLAHFYKRAQLEQEGQDPAQYLPWEQAVDLKASIEDGEEARVRPGVTAWQDFAPTVHKTITTYLNFWLRSRGDQLRVLGVEHVIDFSALYGFPHTRSVDLIVVEPDGKVYFWDHKFVGRINRFTLNRYTLDGQFLDYQVFGRAYYGEHWGGARLNLVRWPQYDKKKDEEVVEFHRDLIGPAPHALAQRTEEVQRVRAELEHLKATRPDPWSWPKRMSETVCQGPFGACPGQKLCRFGPPQSEEHAPLAVLPG